MAVQLTPGVIVRLAELQPGSSLPYHNQSLRVLGVLESFDVVSGIAIITDAGTRLRVDLQHLRDLSLRVGSLFEYIGELSEQPLNQLTLKARVGRNADGLDIKLFDKVLQLRRKFESNSKSTEYTQIH